MCELFLFFLWTWQRWLHWIWKWFDQAMMLLATIQHRVCVCALPMQSQHECSSLEQTHDDEVISPEFNPQEHNRHTSISILSSFWFFHSFLSTCANCVSQTCGTHLVSPFSPTFSPLLHCWAFYLFSPHHLLFLFGFSLLLCCFKRTDKMARQAATLTHKTKTHHKYSKINLCVVVWLPSCAILASINHSLQ